MSHQCLADAFAPAEARYKAAVMVDTWGHLAPKKNTTYRGHFVFAVGCFGSDHLNPTAIECEFNDPEEELESSPWFYEALNDFMQEMDTEAGGVYRWEGTFRNYTFRASWSACS